MSTLDSSDLNQPTSPLNQVGLSPIKTTQISPANQHPHKERTKKQSLHWWNIAHLYRLAGHALKPLMPRRLFPRSLIIIVTPVVLTQIIITYIFFERHWDIVTSKLSESVAGDIAMLIDTYETFPAIQDIEQLTGVALRTTGLSVAIHRNERIPTSLRQSPFPIIDRTLGRELEKKLDTDFWFDVTRYAKHVEIRVQIGNDVMRVIAPTDRVIATNGHIFLLWMIGSSFVLLTVAIIFLRNQVRPIQRLATAATSFGMGHEVHQFKPSGATEVRRAADAFLEMRERIKRYIEQRTMLLAGVSHDLKTPITRMKLELEMMPESESTKALRQDLSEMEHMLDEYLTFARGQGSEASIAVHIGQLTEEIVTKFQRAGHAVGFENTGDTTAIVRRNGISRGITNLIENAVHFSGKVAVRCRRKERAVEIIIDDNGPGISDENKEDVFKPFVRLDESRNLQRGGVGLGLAIARDIARGHGGDIILSKSPLGGLRATITIPVKV